MGNCVICGKPSTIVCDFCDKKFCDQHWKGHAHVISTGEEINAANEEDKQRQLAAITEKQRLETEERHMKSAKSREQIHREERELDAQIEDEEPENEEPCPNCGGSGMIPAPYPICLMICWKCGGSGHEEEE